jgi:hypothetical protein
MIEEYERKFFDFVPPEMLLGGAKKWFYVWDDDLKGLLARESDPTVFCVLSEGWCAMKGKSQDERKAEWIKIARWSMQERDEGTRLRKAKWLAAGGGGKFSRHWSLDMTWHMKYVAWKLPDDYGATEVGLDAMKSGVG